MMHHPQLYIYPSIHISSPVFFLLGSSLILACPQLKKQQKLTFLIKLIQIIRMQTSSPTSQQIFSSEQQDLQCIQLRQRISIRQLQLHNLISDRQKFMSTVLDLLNQALGKIFINQKQELKFALVFLKQSEKVLEYAASSGKNISKELIINVLHNQAAIYQKLWELNNCSNYLEGIIYNYDQFIKETSTQGSIIQTGEHAGAENCDPVRARMKQKLARYNLQFCAVNSQLVDHQAALVSVKRAHNLMNQCILGSLDEIKRQFNKEFQANVKLMNTRISLLLGLVSFDKRFQQKFDYQELNKSILKCAHFSLQILEENKKNRHDYCINQDKEYAEYLMGYSIGNIVEIVPLKFDSSQIGLVSVMKDKSSRQIDRQFHVHNKIILLSTCFFSKATELRLKSVEIYKKNMEERKFSREYKLSVNYHLLAVIMVALFVPYQVKYLNEILLSYEKHYGVSLVEYKTVQPQSLTKIAELLKIEVNDHSKISDPNPIPSVKVEEAQVDLKNDYNLKINFDSDRVRKLDKIKSLKKITKQLTEPAKKFQENMMKTMNKSRENKTSFSISKKERTLSKNETLKKSPNPKEKDAKEKQEKQAANVKGTPKGVKSKKSPNEMMKSRNREEKKSRTKQIIDQTEELFFCFTKKTKKTQGMASPNSQIRSSSIGSTSAKSKNSKKSLLSPRNMKIKPANGLKTPKSPPQRKNLGQAYYF